MPHLAQSGQRPPAVDIVDDDAEEEENLDGVIGLREEVDDLGFFLPPEGDDFGESLRAYARWFEPKAKRRRRRFEVQRQKLAVPGDWMALMKKKALKNYLRKGVPAEHRREVWWSILGCEARRQQASYSYAEYLAKELDPKIAVVIENDLKRTFPGHSKFRTAAGRGELRNVLSAFANYSPRVQYCQGLNFIAALLLVVQGDEERAFWALACGVESLGVEGYYTEGMTLLRADMDVLTSSLMQKCPKVGNNFQKQSVELISICSEWFITWFAKCLPVPTILRVWDTLFFEGYKVLFRVALGVFKRAEPEVLQCNSFDAIMERAKSWPRRMVEHNELLRASFRGMPRLRRRDLQQARDIAMCKIEREDAERQQRRLKATISTTKTTPCESNGGGGGGT